MAITVDVRLFLFVDNLGVGVDDMRKRPIGALSRPVHQRFPSASAFSIGSYSFQCPHQLSSLFVCLFVCFFFFTEFYLFLQGIPRFSWAFPSSIGFYWVLLGFTGFYRALLGFYRVLPSFTGFYLVLLGFTGFYLVLLGFTGFYWVLPSFNWVLPSFTGFYLVLLGFT